MLKYQSPISNHHEIKTDISSPRHTCIKEHWQTWLGLVIPLIMQYLQFTLYKLYTLYYNNILIFYLLTFICTILRMYNVFYVFPSFCTECVFSKNLLLPNKIKFSASILFKFFIQIEHKIQKCKTSNLQALSNKRRYKLDSH